MAQAESASSEAQPAPAAAEAAQPAPAPAAEAAQPAPAPAAEPAQPAPAPAEEPATAAPAESVSTPEPAAAETPAAPQQESAAPAESQPAQSSADTQQSASNGKLTEKEGQTAGKAETVTVYYAAAEGGSVSSASEVVQASSGQAVGSEAKAAEGFVFKNWTASDGTVVSTNAFFAPQIPPTANGGNYTYTAHFEKAAETPATRMVTVQYVAGNGGTVDRDSETVDVLSADAALLGSTATAQEGYQFVDWTASDDSIVSSNASIVPALSADMPEKTVYIANFKKTDTMPAQDFEGSVSGVQVTVHADEGRFPEGTTMHLASVPMASILNNDSVQDAVGEDKEVVDAIAVDITFQDKDGKEIEPAGTISVNMSTSRDVGGESHQVLHIDDSGNASQVTDASAEGATFEASEFSIYVIAGSDENQTPAIATYIFHDAKGNEISGSTQKVKDGETVYAPTTPEKAGSKFLGWSYTKDATELQNEDPGVVDKFNATVSSTKEVKLYPVFREVYYVFFMDYQRDDQRDDQRRVITTKEGVSTDRIDVADVTIPLDSTHSVTGWYTDQECTNKVEFVELLDHNVTLYPKVEEGHYLYFSSGEGATYVKPVFVAAGSRTTIPEAPTRPGYNFKYWSKSEDGSVYQFGNTIAEDITLHAVWEAANNTNYTVIFWKQSVNDSKNAEDSEKTYDYAESAIRIGTTGASVSPSNADRGKGYTGFTYNSSKSTSVTINGDGTTILNVYYDRNLLTIEYYTWTVNRWGGRWSPYKTYTGLYGQTLAQNECPWPDKYDWHTGHDIFGNTSGTHITFLDAFISDDYASYGDATKLKLYGSDPDGSLSIKHYKQNLDGKYSYDSPANSTRSNGGNFKFTNKYTGFTISDYFIGRDTPNDGSRWSSVSAGSSTRFGNNNNLYVRYTRNSYHLAYYNYNGVVNEKSLLYEASLNSYSSYVPTRPAGLPEAYTFQGWFKDKECTVPFGFNSTMPSNDVMIYAKWAARTYTGTVHLTIDGNGGTVNLEIPYRSKISQNDMPQIEQDGNIIETGDGSKGTVTVPDGYDWAGWCTKDGDTYIRYIFDTEVTGDIELYPYWINKSGYSVTYDKNGGKGDAPNDLRKYAENSHADIMTAKGITAPEGKTFLYWGTKQDGTGEKAYPGGKLKVAGDITLYAIYGDTAVKTLLIYHANYPNGKEPEPKPIEKELDNNTAITLEEAGFTAPVGYYFTGWTRDQDGEGELLVPGTQVGIDNNKQNQTIQNHLYAKWEKLKEITLVAKSENVIYDGQLHTAAGVKTNVFTLASGTYTVTGYKTSDPSSTDVCEKTNSISGTLKVTDSNGKDVTKQFKINKEEGKLTISKRPVTITSGSNSWPYDGNPHSEESARAATGEKEGFVGDDGATYSNFATITNKDTVDNTFEYTLKEGTSADNYEIKQVYGKLEITPADEAHITINGNNDTQTYDGTEKTVSGYTTSKLPAGISVALKADVKAEAKGINAGEYSMGLTEDSFDVGGTENYKSVTVTVNDGKLTISKRPVTITSGSNSWPYDGSAHSVETATADGFVGNDGATYSNFKTITNKGIVDNTFDYT
ncbi:MAG: InlB B-repeat-containing protein, partial [Galactobacillus timonensis]|nr:InlB B-repeat-containing protein [Galactobacillus timonensis]